MEKISITNLHSFLSEYFTSLERQNKILYHQITDKYTENSNTIYVELFKYIKTPLENDNIKVEIKKTLKELVHIKSIEIIFC